MTKNIIALAGPPCSGKSTVGRILSVSLQADFIDIDRRIEAETGHTIEWIFSNKGEQAFRDVEKRILLQSVTGSGSRTVIALGGGALLDPDSCTVIERETILFTLSALPETLVDRNSGQRPLAANDEGLRTLLKNREGHYLSLGNQVSTEKRTPQQVSEVIRKAALPLLSPPDRPF
ncbi:MAG: shikimate kinase [Candidatus Fermentibacteria bacterium]|nr:shikimate kinase [Candidatus Fermentibacteria bacterium]